MNDLARRKRLEDAVWYSLGLKVSKDSELLDVQRYGPPIKAKLVLPQTIVKIRDSSFNDIEQLADAIKEASSGDSPIRSAVLQEGDD